MKILIKIGDIECEAELFRDVAPKTVEAILKTLPIKSHARKWGDEIYFETDVEVGVEENSRDVVEIGDVAYWIPGRAICLFFGKTPMSDDRIRPASSVNVIGKITSEIEIEEIRRVREGERVTVTKATR